MFTIATFYRFVELENYTDMQSLIKEYCLSQEIKGTILLAEEGINATISGSKSAIENFFSFMNTEPRFLNLKWKASKAEYQPFERMKVRLKQEIVNLAVDGLNVNNSGKYLPPEEWDDFISQDGIFLIDARNNYEIKLGKFKNSVDPDTENFRDFPKWVQNLNIEKTKKVAMYCTGGIRCEKSTAYMKSIGFENVYHLEGGILNYLKKTNNKKGLWKGDCFVFDDRVAVDHSLNPSNGVTCVLCGRNASTDDLKSVPRGKVVCQTCLTLNIYK